MLYCLLLTQVVSAVQIERTALVLHSAMDMYRLVHDVPSYPHFLSWCQCANVIEQTTEKQIASLTVIVAGLTQTFTTRNTLTPGQQLSLALVDGPFSRLAVASSTGSRRAEIANSFSSSNRGPSSYRRFTWTSNAREPLAGRSKNKIQPDP